MKRAFASLLLMAVCTACNSGSDPLSGQVSNNSFMPLTIGNFWNYNIYYYDSLGQKVFSAQVFDTVVKSPLHDSEWSAINEFYLGPPQSISFFLYFRNTSQGLRENYYDHDLLDAPYPAHVNDTFSTLDLGSSGGEIYYDEHPWKVTALDTVVGVQAGSFHCIVYASNPAFLYPSRRLYSPGIGIVAETDSLGRLTKELVKYEFH